MQRRPTPAAVPSAKPRLKESVIDMNSDEMKTGTVFNIQRYSFQDGPGIRTLIFLKGCLLGCLWCANPEGQRFQPALSFIPRECIGCGKCAAV